MKLKFDCVLPAVSACAVLAFFALAVTACGGSGVQNPGAGPSSGGSTGQPSQPSSPPSSQPVSSTSVPSLADERDTYRRWGWTWSADKEPAFPSDTSYFVTNIDVHGGAEGDDLWTYLMMYRRTGERGYLDRAMAWARYFKEEYRLSAGFSQDRGFLLDHLYGWGLVALYEFNGDTAALAEAENIAAEVEAFWNEHNSAGSPRYVPGQYRMAQFGLRQGARHLLLATRVAEATGKQRWAALRDKLIDLWLQSPDWDSTYGTYFVSDFQTDREVGSGAYAAGARVIQSFHVGILTEAFDHAYRTTNRAALRDRMVTIGRFVDQYGIDPTFDYSGRVFGIVGGQVWHNYSASTPVTFWDPVYTTSLVNTLMRGYRYSGESRFYDRAKHFFNRGTKGIYGQPVTRAAADDVVHHFVDTKFSSADGFFYLDYNKGELQYTYLIFEAP